MRIPIFIPGSAAIGGSPSTGYTVTIDEGAPTIASNVYFLQPPARPTTSTTTLSISICGWDGNVPSNCQSPAAAQVDPQPYLVGSNGQTIDWTAATVSGGSYTWNLPAGTWTLYQQGWPYGYIINGQNYNPNSPYAFTVDGSSPFSVQVLDVYPVVS